mgnify:CR=1 FL=1
MLKIITFSAILSFILFLGCKDAPEQMEKEEQKETIDSSISEKDIEQLEYTEYLISDLATETTQNWVKFQELLDQIIILKKGELSFFEDKALLKSFITDLKNEVPESLNDPSIHVRLSVLETTFLKIESLNNLGNVSKETKINYIKDMLLAYNNLVIQINKKLEKDSQPIVRPN